jgi:predicted ATPase
MIHLKTISLKARISEPAAGFPFNVSVLQSLSEIRFTSPVTFFVGENGSGKSTLIEAVACAAGSIAVGSDNTGTDRTLESVRKFAESLKLTWSKRTRRGFFLRAEDFFGYAKRMNGIREELEQAVKDVEEHYKSRSVAAQVLAKKPYLGQLGEIRQKYGEGLDSYSHGESFLALFQARFVPNGLYLLDEPEAPLSPVRQLAFLASLKDMVQQNGQFVIATHSPILMAFPDASILSFDGGRIREVAYEDLEHVTLTRAFLNNPQAYLKHL